MLKVKINGETILAEKLQLKDPYTQKVYDIKKYCIVGFGKKEGILNRIKKVMIFPILPDEEIMKCEISFKEFRNLIRNSKNPVITL